MTEPLTVLIVDDSEDDRELYRRALRDSAPPGHRIFEAASGDEAFALLEDAGMDCILLDYSLPGRNGLEILKQIRATHPFAAVVMMTGQGSEAIAVAAMREGAHNYITKASVTSESLPHVIQLAAAHGVMARRISQQRDSLALFTRALAHDLKEPVRTIRSFLDLMCTPDASAERTGRYLTHIRTAADRMSALIDAVHFYTGLEDGARAQPNETCDIAQTLAFVLADLDQLVRESGARVEALEPLPLVRADPLQLRQLLQNLVSNAIHHAVDASPVVRVSAIEDSEGCTIRVTDNGPGVPEAQRLEIFKPFARLSNTRRGLGLGLAICRQIIDNHNGRIWCEGRVGEGAIFAFTLPATIPTEAPAPPDASAHDAYAAFPATILVVDDNEVDLELAQILLLEEDRLSCRLLTAGGAMEASTILQAGGVDLVLLDINMPMRDGFALLRDIRADAALNDVVVFMCTTSDDANDVERARKLGADGYITKPARLATIRSHLKPPSSLFVVQERNQPTLVKRIGKNTLALHEQKRIPHLPMAS